MNRLLNFGFQWTAFHAVVKSSHYVRSGVEIEDIFGYQVIRLSGRGYQDSRISGCGYQGTRISGKFLSDALIH